MDEHETDPADDEADAVEVDEEPREERDADEQAREELDADEAYCTSCGAVIKAAAEICPECGVRQTFEESSESSLPESRTYELQKIARRDKAGTAIVGFLLAPVAYLMVGKTALAIINFLTFNYFLFGVFIVPLHSAKIIGDARRELERNGESW